MFTSSTYQRARFIASALPARSFSTTPRSSLARMQLIGRLAAEPELVATSTGRDLIRYAVGTKAGKADNVTTSWFNVVCFDSDGPKKDFLLGLPKGTLLHVDAEARMSSYENESGKHRKLDLVQRSIEVLSRPRPLEPAEDAGSE